jgi:sialic acid synthase SpsE/spore coat polysaccharide biosynthesis protein SpsF (cytidylyltransferase family)
MKIGIIILCRYNSRRLPGKALTEIQGRTILSYIVERVQLAAPSRPLVVATSIDKSDNPIASYCQRAGIECFRGSLNDVSNRFLSCADSYNWDYAVRINGDNLFVDINSLHAMLAIADTAQYDFVTNVPGRTFPYGMSIEIMKVDFYRIAVSRMEDPKHHEHVTSYLYDNSEFGDRYVYINQEYPEASGLHLAIDTLKDIKLANKIACRSKTSLSMLNLKQIYNFATRNDTISLWKGESGPMLIAEIGGNHEGDFSIAKSMVIQAIDSGCDCVKLQLYNADTLVSPVESPDRNSHFKKFELTKAQHIFLAKMCRKSGVIYLASVWSMEMLDWIDPYLDFYKIGSGDMTAWPLLREFALRGKPILLSTGLSSMDEVLQTVKYIQSINSIYSEADMLCIMQCTSMYPIPDSDANLLVMDSFRSTTGVAVGYSDHTIGMVALRGAAAMGADVLEFHFTDFREGKTFRDHQVSLVAKEVLQLKSDVSQIVTLRGDGIKIPQQSELDNKHEISFRRGVYVNRHINAGELIQFKDLICLRPAHGTDARDTYLLIGAKAMRDLEPYCAIINGIDYNLE